MDRSKRSDAFIHLVQLDNRLIRYAKSIISPACRCEREIGCGPVGKEVEEKKINDVNTVRIHEPIDKWQMPCNACENGRRHLDGATFRIGNNNRSHTARAPQPYHWNVYHSGKHWYSFHFFPLSIITSSLLLSFSTCFQCTLFRSCCLFALDGTNTGPYRTSLTSTSTGTSTGTGMGATECLRMGDICCVERSTFCVRILFINFISVHTVLRYIFIYERLFTTEKSNTLLVELPWRHSGHFYCSSEDSVRTHNHTLVWSLVNARTTA